MAEEKMGAYKRKGAAESKELSEDGPVIDENKKTAGPGRSSGYTQNFGPARVNGYTKGAAKVNSIMGRGPAQSLSDLKKFAIKEGEEVSANVKSDRDERDMMHAAGQYADSLNLVASGQPNKAQATYGNKLSFGNVAGIPTPTEPSQGRLGTHGNTSMSSTGVPVNMVSQSQSQSGYGVKDDFDADTVDRQKAAGSDFIDRFNSQN